MSGRTAPQTVAGRSAPASNTDEAKAVFHEEQQQDQAVVSRINRNIRVIIRRNAAKRAWATRKRFGFPERL